jgi:hypothetical protein
MNIRQISCGEGFTAFLENDGTIYLAGLLKYEKMLSYYEPKYLIRVPDIIQISYVCTSIALIKKNNIEFIGTNNNKLSDIIKNEIKGIKKIYDTSYKCFILDENGNMYVIYRGVREKIKLLTDINFKKDHNAEDKEIVSIKSVLEDIQKNQNDHRSFNFGIDSVFGSLIDKYGDKNSTITHEFVVPNVGINPQELDIAKIYKGNKIKAIEIINSEIIILFENNTIVSSTLSLKVNFFTYFNRHMRDMRGFELPSNKRYPIMSKIYSDWSNKK